MLCGVALPSGAVCHLIGQPHHMQAKALDRIGVSANINMGIILRTCHDKGGYRCSFSCLKCLSLARQKNAQSRAYLSFMILRRQENASSLGN